MNVWVDIVVACEYNPAVTEDEATKFEEAVILSFREKFETDIHCMGEVRPIMKTYFICDADEFEEDALLDHITTVAMDTGTRLTLRVHQEITVDRDDPDPEPELQD